ncbi:hypothetical protein E1J25_13075 [Xanthomonas hortorum pv. taraxaci]|nr:hypothetical protein [Xanthomonas hortorum pv. taraxaci]
MICHKKTPLDLSIKGRFFMADSWFKPRQSPAWSRDRARGALAARGTRRESVLGGSVAASMPPHGPASGEDTAPESESVALLKALHTDHLDWSLPAHRRGTLRGMDAA